MEDFEKELMSDSEVTRIIEPDRKDDVGKMPAWVKWAAIAVGALAALFVVLMATGVIKFGNKDEIMAKVHEFKSKYVQAYGHATEKCLDLIYQNINS